MKIEILYRYQGLDSRLKDQKCKGGKWELLGGKGSGVAGEIGEGAGREAGWLVQEGLGLLWLSEMQSPWEVVRDRDWVAFWKEPVVAVWGAREEARAQTGDSNTVRWGSTQGDMDSEFPVKVKPMGPTSRSAVVSERDESGLDLKSQNCHLLGKWELWFFKTKLNALGKKLDETTRLEQIAVKLLVN